VLTSASLRTAAGHHPRGTSDPRRFRANILIGLDADVEIFRTLARHQRGQLGVWSDVLAPGRLSVGDRGSHQAATP